MLRGNRRGATRSDRKRNIGRNSSRDPNPSGSATCGLPLGKLEYPRAWLAARECPPPRENGLRLHKRAFREGRSRDLSLQEGHTVLSAEEERVVDERTLLNRLPVFA